MRIGSSPKSVLSDGGDTTATPPAPCGGMSGGDVKRDVKQECEGLEGCRSVCWKGF